MQYKVTAVTLPLSSETLSQLTQDPTKAMSKSEVVLVSHLCQHRDEQRLGTLLTLSLKSL